jgi:hypothetical protein
VIQRFNIPSLLRERSGQASFHVAAERHVRIEYRNMTAGDTVGPFTYDGDIVVTCYAGEFQLEEGTNATKLGELEQAVVPHGSLLKTVCESRGTVQLIWSPPQARTTQEIVGR